MKSKQLHNRLAKLAKSENLLEVIKDCELSKVKGGGDCQKLTDCSTFVTCEGAYKATSTSAPTVQF